MKRLAHSTAAFSLVEITLALGVAAIFLIAIFGLLPVGVQINQKSTSQTDATAIMSNVIADMRATPAGTSPSTQYNINLTANSITRLWFRDTLETTGTLSNARYLLYVRIPPN